MRRAKRRIAVAIAAAIFVPATVIAACVRHADVRDDPDSGAIDDPTPQLDAALQVLDSGLGSDAFPACAERPEGDCVGTNDFPCEFYSWAEDAAETCQKLTGCTTNGTVEVTMGTAGCVTAIAMDQPNQAMLACLLAEFSSVRCPCTDVETVSHYFGLGNTGTCAGE